MTMTPQTEAELRRFFRYLNKFMVLQWRLGVGPLMSVSPDTTGQFMVIVNTGRKTGKRRCTPVNYAEVDGEIYCTAGFGSVSHWYQNIIANPEVEIWIGDERWAAVAEDVSDHPDRLRLLRAVLKGSGFAAQLAGIDPQTVTDDELAELTPKYRMIHMRRVEPRTGAGGPGDLVWVWPMLVTLLLPLALRGLFARSRQRGRRRK
ncbi:MAG: nitroreductase family deazaflavin-dependent oxidoreductase [Anaerolineae bacterium]|nr:nitroreductase family deazaflavin-dependent oxidoreductase [Anaerolineae bacterium]